MKPFPLFATIAVTAVLAWVGSKIVPHDPFPLRLACSVGAVASLAAILGVVAGWSTSWRAVGGVDAPPFLKAVLPFSYAGAMGTMVGFGMWAGHVPPSPLGWSLLGAAIAQFFAWVMLPSVAFRLFAAASRDG